MAAKVLIATTCRWISAARLGMAFQLSGCAVDAVCPAGHPILATRCLAASYPYRATHPIRSIRAAMLASSPAMVIPCDDLALHHLHHLYELEKKFDNSDSKTICELLECSLGDPASFPITGSRDKFMAMVFEEGILTPETKTISSIDELHDWISQHGLPAVLKADGTSGGEGVQIVHTSDKALRAYRSLTAPLPTLIAGKRACLDNDWTVVLPWLRQQKRAVSIQSFVSGPDANVAAAAWQGKLLASTTVEVLQTWRPKGPATLIRLIENEGMLISVEKILRRLNFSGLCGFDFMIDSTTGDAYLIEMNARATQTCPLPLGPGHDPVASLSCLLTGKECPIPPLALSGNKIAMFPLAWQGDLSSEVFQSAYHDIPWEEPELVRFGMKMIRDRPQEKWVRWFSKMGLHSQ